MMVGVRLAAAHASVRFGLPGGTNECDLFLLRRDDAGRDVDGAQILFNCMCGVGGRLSDDGRVTMRVVRARFGWAEAGKRLSAATVTRCAASLNETLFFDSARRAPIYQPDADFSCATAGRV